MILTRYLVRFDPEYFYPNSSPHEDDGYFLKNAHRISNTRAAGHLATYIYDTDYDMQELLRVYKEFPNLFPEVLQRLADRHHDT